MMRAILAAFLLGAAPALAEDVALIVGNGSYDNARGLWGADDLAATADVFEAAGFRIFTGEDLAAEALRRLASDFVAAADGSGRIAIALAGHFVQSGSGSWFLGTDTEAPDLIAVGAEGLSLATLYEIAARAPGRGVVLLGSEDRSIRLGAGLVPGTGALPVPQGVAVIRGDAGELADFVEDALLEPGAGLAGAVARHSDLTAEGFVTDAFPFQVEAAEEAPPPGRPTLDDERAAWAAALALNTIEGYQDFLARHPGSSNAVLSRAAIERLRAADPQAGARAAEAALNLTRDQRRSVQRNLSLLGYNTRGIDGIFGPATRGAVSGWQRANGYEETGYLSREEVERIDAQAARRAAELEAEAEARQAEQERQDRAYWADTGAHGDEAGLRAYLRRYPDGLYAEVARERLAPFEEDREAEAAAADRAAWDRARERNTIAAYREYLAAQPRGAFREAAGDRITELEREAENAEPIRTEEALGLNPFTRNLIEARLDALGLRPGRVDGTFDDNTRRAIRRYQAARNLPATGYLTQDTVVRLLADSILR
ncbi:MAG: peptidoglycan-binding protein [Paracoccaceae bacterium]|nr:peptidoglycan-binding protein [Paracoccaceae bacterium]